jgi:hypothetical protein
MTWSSNETVSNNTVVIDGMEHRTQNSSGEGLVSELITMAREAGIGKFEVKDANGNTLEKPAIVSGSFSFPLRINRINTAA